MVPHLNAYYVRTWDTATVRVGLLYVGLPKGYTQCSAIGQSLSHKPTKAHIFLQRFAQHR